MNQSYASDHQIYAIPIGNQTEIIRRLVLDGYVLIQGAVKPTVIHSSNEMIQLALEELISYSKNQSLELDYNGFAVSILEEFARTYEYQCLTSDEKLLDLLACFLGPDIGILGYDALWINAPSDSDPVLLKNQHVDAWTGTSVNSLFVKFFFTDVDKYNGVCVSPGSHLQGLIPVRNRGIDPSTRAWFDDLNLDTAARGDVLIWHPLLVHSTAGHSPTALRISMTSRYTSTESSFSSQERALGIRPLRVGPLNQVLRIIGSDHLLPFRTYGGHVGIDRRMSGIYRYGNFEKDLDYRHLIKKYF